MIAFRILLALFLGLSLFVEAQAPRKSAATPKSAADDELYRNATFRFRYKIPYGWVDRTKEMNEPATPQTPDSPGGSDSPSTSPMPGSKPGKESASAPGAVLLAIFERPPNAPGNSINSTVLIASESAAAYPGLRTAEDYLGPLTELATAKDFKPEGDPGVIQIDSRQLIRADFSKPVTDKLTMHQSTLILLAKGQIVSFTFIAGSEDEVGEMIEALHFTATRSGAPAATKR